jgi:integrase
MPKTTSAPTPGIRPVPIAEFRDEVFDPASAPGSLSQTYSVRRALCIAEQLGASTTSDLTEGLLDRFVSHLEKTQLAPSTRLEYVRAFKRACDTAVRRGRLAVSPFKGRPDLVRYLSPIGVGPKRKGGRPRFQSPAEFWAVMAQLEARAHLSFINARAYAVVSVIAHTGLWHIDAARLRVTDIDFEQGLIRVRYRDRRARTGVPIAMPAELARVLKWWLERRSEPISDYYKLDERKIAEMRRLREDDGLTLKELSERFKVTKQHAGRVTTPGSGLPGAKYGCWPGVPAGGDVTRRVADSEWLFPQLVRGSKRPWLSSTESWEVLKEAGKAAGVEGVRLGDFRYIHRYFILPALVRIDPDKAARRDDVPPVVLGTLKTRPVVLGAEMEMLTEQEYDCLVALRKFYPTYISFDRLVKESGVKRPDRILQKLAGKHPLWAKVLDVFPGERPGRKGGYGLKWE